MCYDEQYFRSLNYSDYLGRQVRYSKTAQELDKLFGALCLANTDSTILDYGCAVGFLMNGFRALGYTKVYGYDISEWAVSMARESGNKILDNLCDFKPDVIVALDVFEHMVDAEICELLGRLRSRVIVVRIPCSVDGKDFALEVSRRDPMHRNCKTKAGWVMRLCKYYDVVTPINLFTIYDSPGVACLLGINNETTGTCIFCHHST